MRLPHLLLLLALALVLAAASAAATTLADLASAPAPAAAAPSRPSSRADAAARAARARAVDDVADAGTRLPQVQVVGASRSYRVAPPAVATEYLRSADGRAALAAANRTAAAVPTLLNVTRDPLGVQADRGLRAFHFDAWGDPRGGAYARGWAAPTLAGGDGTRDADAAALKRPGWKVMADPDFDALSTCVTLASCLGDLKAWSAANPGHTPLFVFIEPRDDPLFKPTDVARGGNATFASLLKAMTLADGPKGLATPPPVDAAALADLNRELTAAFTGPAAAQLMTPAKLAGLAGAPPGGPIAKYVPGKAGTGWPAVADARGKLVLVLVGPKAAAFNAAAAAGGGAPAAFVATPAGETARADALFVDVAVGPLSALAADGAPVAATAAAATRAGDAAAAAARRGVMVRAAEDWGGLEPAAGAAARRDAVARAAHFLFTDYPYDRVGPADYGGGLPPRNGKAVVARCNPATSRNPASVNVADHGCGAGPDDAGETDAVDVGRVKGRIVKAAAAAPAAAAPAPAAAAPAAPAPVAAPAPARAPAPAPVPAATTPPPGPRGIVPATPAPNAPEKGDLPDDDDDDRGRTDAQAAADANSFAATAPPVQASVDDDEEDAVPAAPRRTARVARASGADDDDATPPPRKPKRTSVDDDDEDDEDAAAPRRTRRRAATPAPRATPTPTPPPAPASAGLADASRSAGAAGGGAALEAGDAPDGVVAAKPATAAAQPAAPAARRPAQPADDGYPAGTDEDALYALARPSLLPG